MNKKTIYGIAGVFITLLTLSIISCKKTTDTAPVLTAANITDTIPAVGGTITVSVTCNDTWSIDTTGFGWVKLSQVSGTSGVATITATAKADTTGISRSVILLLNSANSQARRITLLQEPVIYPSYNTSSIAPDATGMGSTATQIAANIKLGINIGNTMEAPGGETGWGNPVITQLWVDSVKKAGFTAIRIPCRWDGTYYDGNYKIVRNSATHLSNIATEQIDATWLARVKQVVQYCVNDGLYAELEIHEGWLDVNATSYNLDTVKAKQKALWEQIATYMRDFDEHLMFGSSNEPYSGSTANFSYTLPTVTNLYNFHQIFINAVRSTGGKNAYRTLVIQAPITSGDLANYYTPSGLPGLPKDNVANKLMMEIHYYGPYQFCLHNDPASDFYYWGKNYHSTTDLLHNSTYGEEDYMDGVFTKLKQEFADKGIPIFVGELGAFVNNGPNGGNLTGADLTLSNASRGHWYSYLAHSALTRGGLPFVWDTGEMFNRNTGAVKNKQILDSLRAGAGL